MACVSYFGTVVEAALGCPQYMFPCHYQILKGIEFYFVENDAGRSQAHHVP